MKIQKKILIWLLFGITYAGGEIEVERPFKSLTPLRSFNQNLLTFFSEGIEVPVPNKNYRADITYFFADLKFRDGALKVCEFGQGKNSQAGRSELMVNGKVEKIIKPYWPMFWYYLMQFNLPVWYIGEEIKPHFRADGSVSMYERFAWDQFQKMGGYYAESFDELENDPRFASYAATKTNFHIDDISSYKGIIIYRYRDDWFPKHRKAVERFEKQHPDFLILDAVSWEYAASKQKFAEIVEASGLDQFRPKSKVYPKKYTPDLAQQIINDLGGDIFVIKPVNSGRSNGIIFTSKEKLNNVLKKMLMFHKSKGSSKMRTNYRPHLTQHFEYWEQDPNDVFLVEQYQHSKPIEVRGKMYDPTMRMVFVTRYEKGKIYAHVLGAYWKIPAKALDEEGTLLEKHKTVSVKKPGFSGLLIAEHDLKQVKELAYQFLPKLYETMLERHGKIK